MLRQRSVRQAVACITLSCFFTACYTEHPLTSARPVAVSRVVAQLTDTGSVAMSNAIGAGAVEVEGIMVDGDAGSWRLLLTRVDHRGQMSVRWNREIVTFPRYALTNVREKVLDKKRSWILAGVITVFVVGSALLFGGTLGGEIPDDPVLPPP